VVEKQRHFAGGKTLALLTFAYRDYTDVSDYFHFTQHTVKAGAMNPVPVI
jgi:hypothetical protein